MSQPPSQPPVPGAPDGAKPPRSGLAVASLVLGILYFVPFAPLVGLVLGIVALSKISSARGALGGRGLATAGVVLGAVFVTLACMAAVLLPALSRAARPERRVYCKTNLKQLGYSIGMYQTDFDYHMPPDLETLCVEGYLKIGIRERDVASSKTLGGTILTCPADGEPIDTAEIDGTCSYIYARVKEPKNMTHPGTIPIMWDRKKWHSRLGGVNVLYADLHVEFSTYDILAQRLEEFADVYEKPPPMPEELPKPERTGEPSFQSSNWTASSARRRLRPAPSTSRAV